MILTGISDLQEVHRVQTIQVIVCLFVCLFVCFSSIHVTVGVNVSTDRSCVGNFFETII